MGVRETEYDTLVLGGGVAGCVLASRLSEDPSRRVGLVEAGPDFGPSSARWPAEILDARALPRRHVWEHDRRLHTLRARVLGGSSSVNGCWHTWPAERDLREWAACGGARWLPESLDPARRRASEQMRLRPVPDEELSAWQRASLVAAGALGYGEIADRCQSSPPRGVGRPALNAVGERRWNAAFAYLDHARDRPNLSVLGGVLVDRLLVRGSRVLGVTVVAAGQRQTLCADRYVLAAGTFGTPAILLRSGVGPAGPLRRLGVDVSHHRPGVGANLVDHPGVGLPMRASAALTAALSRKDRAGRLYASQVLLRSATSRCPPDAWDLHILPIAGDPLMLPSSRGQYEVGMNVFAMKPCSRGSVALTSLDPSAPPRIRHRFLSDPEDSALAVLRDGVELAEDWASRPPLRDLARFAAPRRPRRHRDMAAWTRRSVRTYWHPVGTCAMGPPDDERAVVDGAGRVIGLAGVTVADASVIPTIPRANTELAVLALAETLAAELAH